MVDATSSLGFYYNQSQSLRALLTPDSGSVSYQEQTEEAVVGQNANGDKFGTAVEVDISVSIESGTASGGSSDAESAGQQALDKIKQGNDQAKAFPKKIAQQQLQHAIAELQFLKLLGNGAKAATEAARIAKEISTAVKNYASGGSGAPAEDATAVSGDGAATNDGAAAPAGTTTAAAAQSGTAASADAAAGDAAATSDATARNATSEATAASAAANGNASAGGTIASAAGQSDDDTFYQTATAALGEIGKFLRKNLVNLESSPDRKTREAGKKAQQEYDRARQALAQAQGTGGAAGTGSSTNAATVTGSITITRTSFTETADAGASDVAAAAAATPVPVPPTPVNLLA